MSLFTTDLARLLVAFYYIHLKKLQRTEDKISNLPVAALVYLGTIDYPSQGLSGRRGTILIYSPRSCKPSAMATMYGCRRCFGIARSKSAPVAFPWG